MQLNLENNSYSFSSSAEIPSGFKFTSNERSLECGTISDKPLLLDARSFVATSNEKDGLIYKNPLPQAGMILLGSKIITDRFNLWSSLKKDGDWTGGID